jgi:hypothetical protein
MSPVIAFVLVTAFSAPNGSQFSVVIPNIASEHACHQVAFDLNAPNHKCIEYPLAVPHLGLADAVQDAVQDGDVVLQ